MHNVEFCFLECFEINVARVLGVLYSLFCFEWFVVLDTILVGVDVGAQAGPGNFSSRCC